MSSKIAVIYGHDISMMTTSLMKKMMPDIPRGSSIVIKPNLVTLSEPDQGATTHTEIVVAVIEYLKNCGFNDISIAEGSWVGASTEACFKELGYYSIRDNLGIKLVDTKKDRFRKVSSHGITMEISETCLEADFLINLPVLKGHCQTLMTHAMKNLKGCLSDKSKRDFHRLGLDRPIAALNAVLHPHLTISDSICGDLDFEEGGNPVETDRMMASADPIALDAYASTLMGYEPEEIGYIKEAIELGITDSIEWEVEELSKPIASSSRPRGDVKRLASYASPSEACSACYASLIRALKIFDEEGGIRKIKEKKIAIGQGYRGTSPEIGVGACCREAKLAVSGCPASAKDILSMLRNL